MAYDDGFYYGQCKIICTTDNVEDNGKTVLVTTNDGKTFSATLSDLRCEFMLPGRTLYKVQLVSSDVTEYTTVVEAGYGDCILVHLSNGYNEVMQKDLLDLDTIKNTEALTYKAPTAQAVKDVNAKAEATEAALNTKLPASITGFSIGADGKPYITYKAGADTVTKKLDGDRSFEIRFTYYASWSATGSVNAGSNSTVTTIIRYDAETKSIYFAGGTNNGGGTGGGNGSVYCSTSLSNISITFNE